MESEEDERKLNELLQIHGLKETFVTLQNLTDNKCSEKTCSHIASLKHRLLEAIKDPEKILAAIEGLLGLLGSSTPFSLPFTAAFVTIKAFLILFRFLSKKSSKMKVIEQPDYLDADIRRKAFAVQSALSSSLHFLEGIHQRKLNHEEIYIMQSQVPRHTGTEFLGELKYKIQELKTGNPNKQNGKTAEKETKEREKETLKRCFSVIALCDLYCVLSILREFVMSYHVTILSNNNVSETITESYLERREYFKTEREEILKVLHEPEPKNASIAAVFEPSKWPKLSEQLKSRPDLSPVLGRPLKVVSVFLERLAMFRHSSETKKLFTRTRYVRVMEDTETKFVLKSKGDRDFTIHLHDKHEITWKIKGDDLQATDTKPSDLSDHFNIVRISNGNVMFSSKTRPTCFIKMENPQNEARLTVVNNGSGRRCQWKLITNDT